MPCLDVWKGDGKTMRSEGERSVKKGTEGDFSFFLSFVASCGVGWRGFLFLFSFFLLFSSLSFSRFFIYFFYFSGMFREGGEKWNSSGNPLAKQKRRRSKREQAGVSLLICCACTRHPYSSSSFSFIETWWRDINHIIMENRKGYQYERYSHTHTHNTHT